MAKHMPRCIVMLALYMTLSGCSGAATSRFPTAAPPTAPTAATDTATSIFTAVNPPADETLYGDTGTNANPIQFGSPGNVGDWSVTILSINLNAAKVVAAASTSNQPPPPGRNFVLIGISATYNGSDTASLADGLTYSILGAGGSTYTDHCGVIPEDIAESGGKTTAGASVEGSLCLSVDTAELSDGSRLILTSLSGPNGGQGTYFTLN